MNEGRENILDIPNELLCTIFHFLTCESRLHVKDELYYLISWEEHKATILFPLYFVCQQLSQTVATYIRKVILQNNNMKFVKFKNLRPDLTFALLGSVELMKWSQNIFPETKWDSNTFKLAIFSENLDILEYLLESNMSVDEMMVCKNAAKAGNLKILEWLRMKHFPWNEVTCLCAAAYGHLELLKWARNDNCPWDEWTCSSAAFNGHLEVLKWAKNNNCPWNEDTCSFAAENGHLEVLKWARNNNCPWDEWTCSTAAENGHLEVLKWAKENGCPNG